MLNRYVSFLSSRLKIFDFLYELLEVLTPYSWGLPWPNKITISKGLWRPSEMSGSTRS